MSVVDDRARRRTTTPGTPSKPETGLAEWTSRIKAIQRQVDEDEEAETKRLEEEIAASRAARLRRSTGAGSRGNSVDFSMDDAILSLKDSESGHSPDIAQSPPDRRRNQDSALKKLAGDGPGSETLDRVATPSRSVAQSAPISLATFMGGRATGPRLTKPAPQQDAHDPTQFVQRTHISTPHPVFGRGGVAMPGMTGKEEKRAAAFAYTSSGSVPKVITTDLHERDRKISTPSIVRFTDEESISSQQTGGDQAAIRQRTISTPTGISNPRTSTRPDSRELADRHQPELHTIRPISQSPSVVSSISPMSSASTPGRSSPFMSKASPVPSRSMSTSPNPRSPGVVHTPTHQSVGAGLPAPKSPNTPILSRPIRAEPRPAFENYHAFSQPPPVSYLRASAQKDPTPSISRLQGRGFVQSMVKVSSQLEASASSGSSPFRDKVQEVGRKANVLDRRQLEAGKGPGASPTSPPLISPKPIAMRKSRTFDLSTPAHSGHPSPSLGSVHSTKPLKPDYTGRSLKSVASLPSISQSQTSQVGNSRPSGSAKSERGSSPPPGKVLGSSKTMISYIKPTKTGDEPVTDRPSSRPPSRPPSAASRSRRSSPEVDELGVRVRQRAKSVSAPNSGQIKRSVTPAPAPSNEGGGGKPLSHLTKDRARKPRKARETTKEAVLSVKFKTETEVISDRPIIKRAVGISRPKLPSLHAAQVHRSDGSLLASTAQADSVRPSSPHCQAKSEGSHPKPIHSPHSPTVSYQDHHRSPLPLSPVESNAPSSIKPSPPTTSSSTSSQDGGQKPPKCPSGAVRHARIPSTGNRATVMDVAWALHEHEKHIKRISGDLGGATLPTEKPQVLSPAEAPKGTQVEEESAPDVKAMIANWGPRNDSSQSVSQMEKRKSSYEKYSAFVLPPVTEEKTPVQSPAGTLHHVSQVSIPESETLVNKVEECRKTETPLKTSEPTAALLTDTSYLEIERITEPLPAVDVDALLKLRPAIYKADPDTQTISVDVMAIVGNSASAVAQFNVFHDSEVLAIIHRFKAMSGGLVGTKLWSWCGKRAKCGEKEERKLQELTRRYNTTLIPSQQYMEPPELVHALGSQLAIRQGTRAHWTSDNTAMHLVRSVDSLIYIDELDLNVKNLCSGFSYCFSLLGTFYTWYGHGTLPEEKRAALEYAQSMAASSNVIELTEEDDDADEMFWMMLGEREYAQAEHWKWRPSTPGATARIWALQRPSSQDIVLVQSIAPARAAVFIVDCVWEYFVVVDQEARGNRRNIMLGLMVATEMSKKTSPLKPFPPPVHVLVLPSQVPLDLRLSFRGIDELELNQGQVPDHMNLLHVDLANHHLQQTRWERNVLTDPSMLPLGLHPSDLQDSS